MSDSAELYLFADTNLFLQCKPLESVDWSAFPGYARIDVVLCRPVQSEIDALKDGGNSRRAKRARLTSSTIRELLTAPKVLRQVGPAVRLVLRHDLRRDDGLAQDLDYTERDDQLVGIAFGFKTAHPDVAVRLLTNDTGPMASAKLVGLEFVEVPETWLLEPESDENDKREKELQAEIARLRKAEPQFDVTVVEPEVKRVEAAVQCFAPLSEAEIDGLMARLAEENPVASDFGPQEAPRRPATLSGLSAIYGMGREVFEPASEKDIEDYKAAHETWLESCREYLGSLHEKLNGAVAWPELTVAIRNAGTRPADNALVRFEAKGDVLLVPHRKENEDDEEEESTKEKKSPRMPRPPTPPKGTWKATRSIFDPMGFSRHGLDRLYTSTDLLPNRLPVHDPNALYWQGGRSKYPRTSVELKCDQWRHAQDEHELHFHVIGRLEPGTLAGAVEVQVHAANLTTPASARVPVRIQVELASCLAFAQELVEDVCGPDLLRG